MTQSTTLSWVVPWMNEVQLLILFAVSLLVYKTYNYIHTLPPYPPGPRGLPILGNTRIPAGPTWETYYRWSQEYGSDVIRFNVFGNDLIILNSLEAARELLEKRSSIYSDRPISGLTMLSELCGLGWSFAFQKYGAEWRDGRKAFQRVLDATPSKMFRPVQLKETRKLLRRLFSTPDDFIAHLGLATGGMILSVAYGIEVNDRDDRFVVTAERTMEAVDATLVPGSYLVDLIPSLKYVPEWLPGAHFKVQARIWRQAVMDSLHKPWQLVKDQMEGSSSDVPESAARSLLENVVLPSADPVYMERVVKAAVGSMYLAGYDTILSIVQSFFLAMLLHPDVQRKAQESVDYVCVDRLPDFDDFDSLPFVHAIVMECLRWYPVASLNAPHECTQDDVYKGYYIPKGSIVIANIWGILHQPEVYQNPRRFDPERFLSHTESGDCQIDSTVLDPTRVAFGFGRRICPGQFLAYDTIWITVASILAVFNIEKAKDEYGVPITPKEAFTSGFVVRSEPFPCSITPRSSAHACIIKDTTDEV